MEWYYAVDDQQVGPVSEDAFQVLVSDGTIRKDTLVWNNTMSDWTEYGSIGEEKTQGAARATDFPQKYCSECGRPFPETEMLQYDDAWVCADCKQIFVQKIKEGVTLGWAMDYAGFWIRFGAIVIDGIILGVAQMIVLVPLYLLLDAGGTEPAPGGTGDPTSMAALLMPVLMWFLQIGLGLAYETWFVGRYAATPGKMACRVKVVRADGSTVSYLRALGRYFAKMLSGFTLGVGYIMAAFDHQKRSLHDRICDTRVVRK